MADARIEGKGTVERPLSPHLQVYRPLINMVMSIVHRLTGMALYFGTLILTWWLYGAASGEKYYAFVNGWVTSPLGLVVLLGFTWALFHHLVGGVRHLIWDTGRGLDLPTVNLLSWMTILVSVGLTVLFWVFVYAQRGGA